MTTTTHSTSLPTTRTARVFFFRGLAALAWAGAHVAAVGSRPSAVTAGVAVLLVAYPLIDVAGSAADARTQRGSERQILLLNIAISTIVAITLGVVATTGNATAVLVVFGGWAILTGAAQQILTLRRRTALGRQRPLQLAAVGSVLFGAFLIVSAVAVEPRLGLLAIYAAGGGLEFVIQAGLLVRRSRSTLPSPATP